MKMHPRLSLRDRFALQFTRRGSDGCWTWSGVRDRDGYGKLRDAGKRLRAHRVSYTLHVGPIPDGMFVLHRCDSPPCVNPAHLFLGTNLDNIADRHAKARDAKGLSSGRHTKPERTARGDRNGARLYPERLLRGEKLSAIMRRVAARGNRNGKHTKPECTPRGERNGAAKLTEAQVAEIRSRYVRGSRDRGVVALGAEFGVDQSTISAIVRGLAWKEATR
jgi:hypothetical protein